MLILTLLIKCLIKWNDKNLTDSSCIGGTEILENSNDLKVLESAVILSHKPKIRVLRPEKRRLLSPSRMFSAAHPPYKFKKFDEKYVSGENFFLSRSPNKKKNFNLFYEKNGKIVTFKILLPSRKKVFRVSLHPVQSAVWIRDESRNANVFPSRHTVCTTRLWVLTSPVFHVTPHVSDVAIKVYLRQLFLWRFATLSKIFRNKEFAQILGSSLNNQLNINTGYTALTSVSRINKELRCNLKYVTLKTLVCWCNSSKKKQYFSLICYKKLIRKNGR